MEVLKSLEHAGHEEAGRVVVEVAPVAERRPQLAAQAHLQQHVHVFGVSECLEQSELSLSALSPGRLSLDYPVRARLHHDVPLREDVLLLSRVH